MLYSWSFISMDMYMDMKAYYTVPLYIRTWTSTDFGIHIGSWNQSPMEAKGPLLFLFLFVPKYFFYFCFIDSLIVQ